MLSVKEFLDLNISAIAIYGIDGGGIATDIYLKKLGLNDKVQFFVAEPNPQHSRFCNKPVITIDTLRAHPEISLITANLDFNNIHTKLYDSGLSNAFYYHASFWPWMDDETPESDLELTGQYYLDEHSRTLLRALTNLRYNSQICRIQPYAGVKDLLYAEDTYWLRNYALNEPELTIIDAGAFNGDTMTSLFAAYGRRVKRYYAFEPMAHIFSQLQQTAANYNYMADIICYNSALYNQNAFQAFNKGVPRSSKLAANGDIMVQCQKLDDLALEVIGKACLKMDIEGAEMAALEGAAEFIKTYHPHLALCLYHKTNDIYKIPQYIQSIAPQYRFTLAGGVHTVCYGRYSI